MADIKDEQNKMDDSEAAAKKTSTTIDIRDLYKYQPEDLVLDISTTHYSNITYMQVAPREVLLDFLEMPGIKKDGKMVVKGVRIYMSHVAAKALIESLDKLLEDTYESGHIEKLEFSNQEDIELTTKISRPTKDEKT